MKNNIYWIGGSSCSGKSTCARLICEKHDFQLYKTDDYAFGKYMFGLQDDSKYPAIVKYRNMILEGMDAFVKRDVGKSFNAFIEYCFEVFPLLLTDITNLTLQKSIVVEGAHILPGLLKSYSCTTNSIFLVCSKEHQRKIWLAEMGEKIIGGHPGEIENFRKAKNKKQIETVRVELHDRIARYIFENAQKEHMECIFNDSDKSIEELVRIVSTKFLLC